MHKLPLAGRIYLWTCYLLGACAIVWFVRSSGGGWTPGLDDWLLTIFLGSAAAACQRWAIGRRSGKKERWDHLTPAPAFAAVLLLANIPLVVVLIGLWLPEWRAARRAWYIQTFNIASYLVAGAITRLCLLALTGHAYLEALPVSPVWSIVLCLPLFLGMQTLLLAWAFKLARGLSLRESGLFAPHKFAVEAGLASIGLGFAVAWLVAPLYGFVTALPLLVMWDALHVPNLKAEATTDPKTGLSNTRHFNAVFAQVLARAERSGECFGLLVSDLDYLRTINNTYGHQAGDTVLLAIADVLREQLRAEDVAARWGGEEFVALLQKTTPEQAIEIAERVRRALERRHFGGPAPVPTWQATISIGVATFPAHGTTAESLFRAADRAVYQAKRDGRNRVILCGPDTPDLTPEQDVAKPDAPSVLHPPSTAWGRK